MYSLPTEPGSIGHTLDAGFKLYIVSFKRVLAMSILAVLSVAVPVVAVVLALATFTDGKEPGAAAIVLITVAVLVALSLYLLFYLAAMCRIGGIAYGQDLSFSTCAATGLRRLFPVILASLLYGLAMLGGFMLLIVPGMILWISLAFYALCIVLEGDGVLESLRHSHRLVWGNWWRTAVIGSVVLVVYYLFSLAIEIPFLVLDQVLFDPEASGVAKIVQPMLSGLGSILSAVITFPLMIAVFVVVFHDLKLRKEGQDLEARVEALTVTA
ncbi:MAG: hypothetical protein GWP69_07395 [Gammaproteobacteria bacterium]|nr:hypothetical protein [Gammaproteobacteria bacterium]NCF81960.1 hypothetical protein [Pseudomonadota bacterium]